MSEMIVTIDAGHGGTSNGAVVNDVMEKDITLAISNWLLHYNAPELKMHHTRIDDMTIKTTDRAKFAKEHNSDLIVSIHCNSFPNEDTHGLRFFYHNRFSDNRLIHSAMHRIENIWPSQLIDNYKKKSTSIFDNDPDYPQAAKMFSLIGNIPCLLIECGFLTNKNDLLCLSAHKTQREIAKCIFMGLLGTINHEY